MGPAGVESTALTAHCTDSPLPTALTAPQPDQGLQPAPGLGPTGASTAVTGQLSDALKQLSLAIDTSTGDKSSGMAFRPEWYSRPEWYTCRI